MLTRRNVLAVGITALAALLTALAVTVGLGGLGWAVGISCGVATYAAVVRGLARGGVEVLGPADRVTLTRATLVCAVAGLTADSFVDGPALTALLALAVAALVLDAVDGWVARRTGTASVFGSRFDGEVDAFLILVLSVYVARSAGAWVLAIGLARYAFAAAGRGLPWLRGPLPFRYWRKVVTATVGVVLAVAAADVLPRPLTYAALLVALALLAESFGRDVWWSWRHRRGDRRAERRRRARVPAVVTDTLAVLVVWFALVAPNQPDHATPSALLRLPVEGLVVAGLAVVLPSGARRGMAVVAGLLLGLLTVVKVLDLGFFAALDRPFSVVTDLGYLDSAVGLVSDSVSPAVGTVALLAVGGLAVAVLVGLPVSVWRLTALAARRRGRSARVLACLGVAWVACAVTGLQVAPGQPVASADAGRLAVGKVGAVAEGVRDQERFDAAAAVDRYPEVADGNLLTGLRGKDVVIVFVESYGRVALGGLPSSPQVHAVLDAGTRRLRAAGYSSRSAFLTSPTFGGLSWLAHATLQSGLWIDSQPRYDQLLAGDRLTLSRAFGRAGWRTVAVMPQNDEEWPEGKRFFQLDRVYDREDMDYRGPEFGWAAVPDQFSLAAFHRLEGARLDRTSVMAQIELVSSHAPWARIPRMTGWAGLGDGSVFERIHRAGVSKAELWRDPENIATGYVDSITYSLRAVISFVQRYGDDDLVLILLGDHQPATVVSGYRASHDVPVTIVARDPAVIDRISGWDWQAGLRPGPQAPVWGMAAFRDRLLAAYSTALPPVGRQGPRHQTGRRP